MITKINNEKCTIQIDFGNKTFDLTYIDFMHKSVILATTIYNFNEITRLLNKINDHLVILNSLFAFGDILIYNVESLNKPVVFLY